jgi:hypothetical protein
MVAGPDLVKSISWKVKEMTIMQLETVCKWVTLWWLPLYTVAKMRTTMTAGQHTGKGEF